MPDQRKSIGVTLPPGSGTGQLTLTPCPFDVDSNVDPWFSRFAGASCEAVRELLQHEWSVLIPPALRRFAECLLRFHPVGILRATNEFDGFNSWLMLNSFPEWKKPLSGGYPIWELDARYLAPPYLGPVNSNVALNDNFLLSFFMTFRGLRLMPPFVGGAFHSFPRGPIEIRPNEFELYHDPQWRSPTSVFCSDSGDELLVSSSGKCGWLAVGSREIIPFKDSFEEALGELVKSSSAFSPYPS